MDAHTESQQDWIKVFLGSSKSTTKKRNIMINDNKVTDYDHYMINIFNACKRVEVEAMLVVNWRCWYSITRFLVSEQWLILSSPD